MPRMGRMLDLVRGEGCLSLSALRVRARLVPFSCAKGKGDYNEQLRNVKKRQEQGLAVGIRA